MALGQSIRTLRLRRGWTLEDLAGRSGVDPGTISALELRDSTRSKYAAPLCKALDVSVETIELIALVVEKSLPTEGASVFLDNEPTPISIPDAYRTNAYTDVYANEESAKAVTRYLIPMFDVEASMGIGKYQPDFDAVVDHIRLTKQWVDANLPAISSPQNLAILSACGDSMSPSFSDGDMVLVDRGITTLKLDAVYVLAFNSELYIKRIQRRITDGAIIIKSDNPLYDPVVVSSEDKDGLQVLGRVVWAWRGIRL